MKKALHFYLHCSKHVGLRPFAVAMLAMVMSVAGAFAQSGTSAFTIHGTIFEQTDNNSKAPMPYAVVFIESYGLNTSSAKDGYFELKNVPAGQALLQVQSLGKITIDTLLSVKSDIFLELTMQDDNFRVKDVVVTATAGSAGQSTSSMISRTAMDHLQATSLKDVLSLLPGNLADNQNLSIAGKINIRSIGTTISEGYQATGSAVDMNSMGVSIIQDGAPISNNANLQNTGATAVGSGTSIKGTDPVSGVDARMISTDNIESVEVIQGIPSVEYGDVTSGVIVMRTKAGKEPMRVFARMNPNTYMVSAGAGYVLGPKAGAMNFNADYAKNYNSLTKQYSSYTRATGKLTYSNSLLNNNWRTNTSLSFLYGEDRTKMNPDDIRTHSSSSGTDRGVTLNTNGTFFTPDAGWLRNIDYTLSATYTARDSYSETDRSNTGYSYSGTTTDGTILSNRLDADGKQIDLFDSDGDRITNFGPGDEYNYAYYVDEALHGRTDIEGREVNLFGKVNATLFKNWGKVTNRILLGADASSEGNEGRGLTFDYSQPIPSPLAQSSPYTAYRTRPFKDVPYVNRYGLYIEDNLNITYARKRNLIIQGGVRYDNVSVAGGLVQPRLNASLDLTPWLSLKGGYGISAKMPSLLYLYPDKAYFEFQNLNTRAIAADDPSMLYVITTTRAIDAQNKDLEMAKKTKSELGLDFHYKRYRLSATYFRERMDNGYMLGNTLETFRHMEHTRYAYDQSTNSISKDTPYNVLVNYSTPTNNLVDHTDGVEFTLDLGRFDAIRTAISVNGAWMRTETYDKGYTFYARSNGIETANADVGVYQQAMQKRYFERLITAVRATHNIPELGFVVTLTAQVTWKEADWYRFGNDSLPVKYISREDGLVRDFPYASIKEASDNGYSNMLRPSDTPSYFQQRLYEMLPPLVCFNINVTKEIGDLMRISFFANNMFRTYPVHKLRRIDSTGAVAYRKRNPDLFFGVELSLAIK